ncbi:hypothetical protein PR048_022839 [Dryococelus australis]|uniref:Helitron helicase-like domain-containing protein n=1 Tax=Dryococelus australis TaxID=614101 RepID=A0ABQ9GSH9_9NEOP|nr:hypothetical protein PR048_022839 [Dryococelus australis]
MILNGEGLGMSCGKELTQHSPESCSLVISNVVSGRKLPVVPLSSRSLADRSSPVAAPAAIIETCRATFALNARRFVRSGGVATSSARVSEQQPPGRPRQRKLLVGSYKKLLLAPLILPLTPTWSDLRFACTDPATEVALRAKTVDFYRCIPQRLFFPRMVWKARPKNIVYDAGRFGHPGDLSEDYGYYRRYLRSFCCLFCIVDSICDRANLGQWYSISGPQSSPGTTSCEQHTARQTRGRTPRRSTRRVAEEEGGPQSEEQWAVSGTDLRVSLLVMASRKFTATHPRTTVKSQLTMVRLLASLQGEPGSVPGQVSPVFSQVGIVPDDAADRRVFSGLPRFFPPFHSGDTPYSPRFAPLALKTSIAHRITSSHDVVGGQVVDYWWSVEFQCRGSPHLHVVVWVKDHPNFVTQEGIQMIGRACVCAIPFEDSDLRELDARSSHTQQGTVEWGRSGVVVRLLASHLGEPGSIPDGAAPGFSHAGIVPDDAAGRWVFSGIFHFPHPFISALLHTSLRSRRLSRPRC